MSRTHPWLIDALVFPLMMGSLLLGVLFWLGIECSYNAWSFFYAIVLVGVYFFFRRRRPQEEEPSGSGCLLGLSFLLLAFFVNGTAFLGLWPDLLTAHARVLFGLAVILCPPAWVWVIMETSYYQVYLRPMLERDLGFQYAKCMEQITITHLQPGGLFDRAGFQEMDVVMDRVSITEFLRKLELGRGKEAVTFTVAPWAVPIPKTDRPTRSLTVRVPPRDFDAHLSRELGFRCAVRYVKEGNKLIGVLTVEGIQPGGLFERVGFQERDIVVNGGAISDFFGRLEHARGREPVPITVIPWLYPLAVEDRSKRQVMIAPQTIKRRWGPERDLGFTLRGQCIEIGGTRTVLRTIEAIKPGGVFDRAGFKNKDIVPYKFDLQFFRELKKLYRGEAVTVTVSPWIDSPPLQDRPTRSLLIHVPC
jgi:hypothetical protein